VFKMPRKRQEGITSYSRYLGKMYSIGLAVAGNNPEIAKLYAETLSQARAMGIGVYKAAWQEAKAVLMSEKVPSTFFGLYRAFTLELVNKVQRRGIASPDDVIAKWVEDGLDEAILRAIADRVLPQFKPEGTSPAQKTA
jgi:hypothetical protein